MELLLHVQLNKAQESKKTCDSRRHGAGGAGSIGQCSASQLYDTVSLVTGRDHLRENSLPVYGHGWCLFDVSYHD